MTYVVISLLASTLFVTALALLYSATGTVNMADLAGQDRRAAHRSAQRVRRAAPRRVRHQGRRCSRCSSGCPTATRRRRRRSPRCSPACSPRSASTRSSAPRRCSSRRTAGRPRCCSSLAGADDGRRRPRRHRPGRRQADPVVQHRQPDRLHGDGARRSSPSPASPAAIFYIDPPHRREDHAVPRRRADRARRRVAAG